MVVMVAGFVTVLIRGTILSGGSTKVWEDAYEGSRLSIFEALYLNLLGLWIVLVCAVFCGLVMYSHYKNCDPWTAGFISAPDQLMPYFVMDIFSSMPGVPGLFVACAFSGTLSTVAASINALATVTFEDLVKQCLPNLSEKKSTWISKGLCRYSPSCSLGLCLFSTSTGCTLHSRDVWGSHAGIIYPGNYLSLC
uniref:Solute carrier family 5 member 8 n=1 Tax=Anas platyrhynchos platyrhynchos TaxID=8840 RepID=U3I6R3_ANAPP